MPHHLPRPEEPGEAAPGPTIVRPSGKRKHLSLRGHKNIRAWTHYKALMRRRKRRK